MNKEEIRKQFPKVTEIVDEFRKYFEVKVNYAKEGNREIGRKWDETTRNTR